MPHMTSPKAFLRQLSGWPIDTTHWRHTLDKISIAGMDLRMKKGALMAPLSLASSSIKPLAACDP